MAQTVIVSERQTVVYTVKITRANRGAWYKDMHDKIFTCTLDLHHSLFGGNEIVFKVLGCYHPIRYIKQDHCLVLKQHFADKTEAYQHYGTDYKKD